MTTAMTIQDIYTQYQIPPNLIRHQLEVAAVGRYVADHWTLRHHDGDSEGQAGPNIDKKLLTEALLLHDMGNIIKFKRPFLGELEKDAIFWEKVQDKYIQKYGEDVVTATTAIVAELGFSEVNTLLSEMASAWSDPERGVSWEARIAGFSDCCVTPRGIEGFEIRISDLKERYHKTEADASVRYMRENLEIIRPHLVFDPATIAKVDFSEEIAALGHYFF